MNSYVVERTVVVAAPPEQVHALLVDLRRWQDWSPWEGLDDGLHREYDGTGAGSTYAWSGNRRAGRGRMRVASDDAERVVVDVHFDKPITSDATSTFLLVPTDVGTEVTWRMNGEQTGLMGLVGRVVPMDKILGKDFEKGLTRLRAAAEAATP